jgi:hypothetical protein
MTDSHIVAQDAGSLTIQGMNAGVVLNVSAVTHLHKVYITSDHCIEPYGAVVTHLYIAYYHGTFTEIAVLAKSGSRHPLQSFYYCHFILIQNSKFKIQNSKFRLAVSEPET